MPLVKFCLPNAWARRNHRRNWCRSTRCCKYDSRALSWTWTVQSIWVRKMLNVRRLTFSVWSCFWCKVFSVTDGSRMLKWRSKCSPRACRYRGYLTTSWDLPLVLHHSEIVRDFQSVIGREAKRQYAEISGGKLPDAVMACIGGGSMLSVCSI